MNAAERIRQLPIWSEPPRIEVIDEGRTNQNFRVESKGRLFFARVGVDIPFHGVYRANELQCCELAARAGIAPEVVHAGDGALVTDFVEGQMLVQGKPVDDQTLTGIARLLRRQHDAPVPGDLRKVDPVAVCRHYLNALKPGALAPHELEPIEKALDGAPETRARSLIHFDLIPENFIVVGERLWLVDWEYAGFGDPAVDLALIGIHFGLDAEQKRMLIQVHGDADPDLVRALEPILAVREVLWCLSQIQFVGLKGDLEDYTRMSLKRLGIERTSIA